MAAVTPETVADDNAQELREWIVAQAEKRGNAVITVAADGNGAGYAFTVCAWAMHEVPEAVVVGLPAEFASVLLDAYVDRAAAGEKFEFGKLYNDFFEGVPVTFEQVAPGHYPEFFGSAFLVYPDGDFPAVQIIVPTPAGHWPWQESAPEGFAAWQPVLTMTGRPESWTPGVDGP
ncbi:DUF4262 domain-containing protein [Prauserella sp. PE36]|uniref:DUF4262 domain-containing protein n=1 Tax=Prauserella endophytica TaxID=1592324 RepID=A0ABY2RXW4_9PSEU|nr:MULTISPECIES: DUF4262 domain-containing protein [Prauserella]PXY23693.1 hypothetical protein BAY59_29055 [Prauserella coralliicola]RBM16750.1 DUF4262 domain-containing protein [Prauserella sp. PE36]TKG64897.1 DUF4262 domain-containing protein [Prauserella endophytica]